MPSFHKDVVFAFADLPGFEQEDEVIASDLFLLALFHKFGMQNFEELFVERAFGQPERGREEVFVEFSFYRAIVVEKERPIKGEPHADEQACLEFIGMRDQGMERDGGDGADVAVSDEFDEAAVG